MKIGPVDGGGRPVGPEHGSRRNEAADSQKSDRQPKDSVEISQSARELAEQKNAIARAEESNAPAETESNDSSEAANTRVDRVNEAKERLEQEYYEDRRIKEEIARRLTDEFLK